MNRHGHASAIPPRERSALYRTWPSEVGRIMPLRVVVALRLGTQFPIIIPFLAGSPTEMLHATMAVRRVFGPIPVLGGRCSGRLLQQPDGRDSGWPPSPCG